MEIGARVGVVGPLERNLELGRIRISMEEMGGEVHFRPARTPDMFWLCTQSLEMEIHSLSHLFIQYFMNADCVLAQGM